MNILARWTNIENENMSSTVSERRERFVQASVGLTRNQLEKISKMLGHWAALAQKRYFAEVHQASQGSDTTGDVTPPPQVVQKLSLIFQEYESLRLQSQRIREALDLFDTAVVPHDYDENQNDRA